MFAVIQDNRIIHYLENRLLCEALAGGFADVAEFRAWQATSTRRERGLAATPPLENVRIVELRAEERTTYGELLRCGFQEGEITVCETPNGELKLSGDQHALSRRRDQKTWNSIREKRNELLQASDKYVLPDFPITDGQRQRWITYRQALRDMPKTVNDPHTVQWPSPPSRN